VTTSPWRARISAFKADSQPGLQVAKRKDGEMEVTAGPGIMHHPVVACHAEDWGSDPRKGSVKI
jgi:hypothetical protein